MSSILNTQYSIYLRNQSDPRHYKLMIRYNKENILSGLLKYITVSVVYCWQALGSIVCIVNQSICEWSVGVLNKCCRSHKPGFKCKYKSKMQDITEKQSFLASKVL